MPPLCLCVPALVVASAALVLLFAGGAVLAHVLERRYERREVRRRLGVDHVHEWRATSGERARCNCGDLIELARKVGA